MPRLLLSLPSGWVAEALKALLQKGVPDANVVLVNDLSETLATVGTASDINLLVWAPVEHPDVKGALRHIAASHPGLPVIVLVPRRNAPQEGLLLQAGARGVLWPGMSEAAVLEAVRLVLRGGTHNLPTATTAPAHYVAQNGIQLPMSVLPHPPAPPPELRRYRLTARQIEVLQLIGEGLTNKSIARRLGLQEGTVKVHLRQILRQLGVKNRTQAALLLRDQPSTTQQVYIAAEPAASTFDGSSRD